MNISLSQLRAFAQECEGKTLSTSTRRKNFTVRVTNRGFEFTPLSSGKVRLHDFARAEQVINHFNNTRSLQPGEYLLITHNASYMLTLIAQCLQKNRSLL